MFCQYTVLDYQPKSSETSTKVNVKNCGSGLLNLVHILTQLKLTIAPWRWYSVHRSWV